MSLSVKNLSVKYEDVVVKNVSFSVQPGEIVGIIGRNGSGKSTLLKGMMKFGKVTGSISIYHQDYFSYSIKKRALYLSMLTQRFQVMEGICVREIISLGDYVHQSLFGFNKHEKEIEKMALSFKIVTLLDKDYMSLSEGQKQLVQLARLTMQDTPVILLDEPDGPLDVDNRHLVFDWMKQMAKLNKMIVVVLHDPALALNYCDRCLLMEDGHLIQEILPSVETCESINEKMKMLYKNLEIKQDKNEKQYYCLHSLGGNYE